MRQLNKRKKSQTEPLPLFRMSIDKKLSRPALEYDLDSDGPYTRRRSADTDYADDSVGSDVDGWYQRRKSAATSVSEETVKRTPPVTSVPFSEEKVTRLSATAPPVITVHSPEEKVTRLSATLFRSLQVKVKSRKGNSLKIKRFNMDTHSAQLLGSFFACEARAREVKHRDDRYPPQCELSTQYRQTSTSLCGCRCAGYYEPASCIPSNPGRHLKSIMSHFYRDLMNLPERTDSSPKREDCVVNSNKSNTMLSNHCNESSEYSSPTYTRDFKCQCKMEKKSKTDFIKENVNTPTEIAKEEEKCDDLIFSCPDTNTCRMGALELSTEPNRKKGLSSYRKCYYEEVSERSEETCSEDELMVSSRSNNQSYDDTDNRQRKHLATRVFVPKTGQYTGKKQCPSAVSLSQTFCVSSTRDCQVKISQNISAMRRSSQGRTEHIPVFYSVHGSADRRKCKQLVCTFDGSNTDNDSESDEKPSYKCLYVRSRSRPMRSTECFRKCARRYCLCHPQSSLAVCDLRNGDNAKYSRRRSSPVVYLSDSSNENMCMCKRGLKVVSPRRNKRHFDTFDGMHSMDVYRSMPKCAVGNKECCCMPKCSYKNNECCFMPKCSFKNNEFCRMPKCSLKNNEFCCMSKCSLKTNTCCYEPNSSLETDEFCYVPKCSRNECCCVPKCSLKTEECCCVPKCSLETNECCYVTQCSLIKNDCHQTPVCSQLPNDCRQMPVCSQLPNDCRQMPVCSQLPNDCHQMPVCSQLPNDCRQMPVCSQLQNDCRQTPVYSPLPNDCRQTPVCAQLPNDCRQTPVCSQLPNSCRQTPLHSQLPNDCYRTPLHSQLPNDCRQTQLQSQLPNDCRQTELHSQLPNDCRQTAQLPNECRQKAPDSQLPSDYRRATSCSQPNNDCCPTPDYSQLPNDCRQISTCTPKFNDRQHVLDCPEQTKESRRIPKYSKEANPCLEETKDFIEPPNNCRTSQTHTEGANSCKPLQHHQRQTSECTRLSRCYEEINDCPPLPDYKNLSPDCSPPGKHTQQARNSSNVCSTFKQTKAVTKSNGKCKTDSTLGEDKKNAVCRDEKSSDMRELCDESNVKPRHCFPQPSFKQVTCADKETTCHLKEEEENKKRSSKHDKKVESGYLDSDSDGAVNVCRRNLCDYMKDSNKKSPADDIGPCNDKEWGKKSKGSNAEKDPIQNKHSDTLLGRQKSHSRNSRKDLPCDEIKVCELRPPSHSDVCICDFDESIDCEQDDVMENARVKRKRVRSGHDDVVKSKGRSRRRKSKDSKYKETDESQKRKSKNKAKSEQTKSGKNDDIKRRESQKSTRRRRSKDEKKSFSSSQSNKVIEPSSSSSNDKLTNPSSNSQSNESTTPSSTSPSDIHIEPSPSSSIQSDQSITPSSSGQLNEPEKDFKEKDKVDHDQSKNGASSNDIIRTNPEESFSQFSCRTNNSSETSDVKHLVLDPIGSTQDSDDDAECHHIKTSQRKYGFCKNFLHKKNVRSNVISNKSNKYKFMFKKFHHGKSKWPECRNLDTVEDDRLPCITETKGSPLPYQIEQAHSLIAFNGTCQEINEGRCYQTPGSCAAEMKTMTDCYNPTSNNADRKKETQNLNNKIRNERNKNVHSLIVNRKSHAARKKCDATDEDTSTLPECSEAFSSTSLVYSLNYQRLLQYWEHICQRCQENTLDLNSTSDMNESKLKSLPKPFSCQEKIKFTNTQSKPKCSQKFSTLFANDEGKQVSDINKQLGPDCSYSCSINQQTPEARCVTGEEKSVPDMVLSSLSHKRKSTNHSEVYRENSKSFKTQESQIHTSGLKNRSYLDSDDQGIELMHIDCKYRHLSSHPADIKHNYSGETSSGKQKKHNKQACLEYSREGSKSSISSHSRKDSKSSISSHSREDTKRKNSSYSRADNRQIHPNHSFKDNKQVDKGYLDSESGEENKRLYSSYSCKDKEWKHLGHSPTEHRDHGKQRTIGPSSEDYQNSHSSQCREGSKQKHSRHGHHIGLKQGQSSPPQTDKKQGKENNGRNDCKKLHLNRNSVENRTTFSRQSLDNSRKSCSNHSVKDNSQKYSTHARSDSKDAHCHNLYDGGMHNYSNQSLEDNKKTCSNRSRDGNRKTCTSRSREDNKHEQPISKCRADRKIKKHTNQSVSPCLGCTNVKSAKIMSPCKFCAVTKPRQETSLSRANIHSESLAPCFKCSKGKTKNTVLPCLSCADVIPEMHESDSANEAMLPCYECVKRTSSHESKDSTGFYASPCLSCTNVKQIKKESPCFTCAKRKNEASLLPRQNRCRMNESVNEFPHRDRANFNREEKRSPTHSYTHSDQVESKPPRANSPTILNQDKYCNPSCSSDSRCHQSTKHIHKHKTVKAETEVDLKPAIPCVCCVSPPGERQSTTSISDRLSTGPTSQSKASTSRSSQRSSCKSPSKRSSLSNSHRRENLASLIRQISFSASSKESIMSFCGSKKGNLSTQSSQQCSKNTGEHSSGIDLKGSVSPRCPLWENVSIAVNDSKKKPFPLHNNSIPKMEESFYLHKSSENRTNILGENVNMGFRENTVETFICDPSSCTFVNEPTDDKFKDQTGPFVEETLKGNMYSQIWFNLLNVQRNAVYDFDCPLSSESKATCVTSISSLPLSQAHDGQRTSASKASCHSIYQEAHPKDTITKITACDECASEKTKEPSISGHGADSNSRTKSLSKNNSDELEIISLEDDWNHYYSVSGKSEECQSQNCSIPPSSPLEETFTHAEKNIDHVDRSKPSQSFPSEQGPSIVASLQRLAYERACPVHREVARDILKKSSHCKSSQGRAPCVAADFKRCSVYKTHLGKKNTFECGSQAVNNKRNFNPVMHKSTRLCGQLNDTVFNGCASKKSIFDCQTKRSMYCPNYGAAFRPPRSPPHRRHLNLTNEPKAFNSSVINSIFNIHTHDHGTPNAGYQFVRSNLDPFRHDAMSSRLGVNVVSAEIRAKILSPPGNHYVYRRPPVSCTRSSQISDDGIVKYLESCSAEEFWRYLYKVKQNYSSDNKTTKNCKSSQTHFNNAEMSMYNTEHVRDTLSHDLQQPIIYPQQDKPLNRSTLPYKTNEMNNLEYLHSNKPTDSVEYTQNVVGNLRRNNFKCEVCSLEKNRSLMRQEKYKEISPVYICRKHLTTERDEVRCRDDTRCCCRNHSHSPKYPTHISIHINTDSPKRTRGSRPNSATETPPEPLKHKKSKKRDGRKVAKSESETSSAESSRGTTKKMRLKYPLASKQFKNYRVEKMKGRKSKKQKNGENMLRKLYETKYDLIPERDQNSTSSGHRRFKTKSKLVNTREIEESEAVGNHIKNMQDKKGRVLHVRDKGIKSDNRVLQKKVDLSPTLAWMNTDDSIQGNSKADVEENRFLQDFSVQGKIEHIDRLQDLDIRELLRDAQEQRRQAMPQAMDSSAHTRSSSRFHPEASSSKTRTSQRPKKTGKTLNLCPGATSRHSKTATFDPYTKSSSYSSSDEIQSSQTSIAKSSKHGVKKQNITFISTTLQDAKLKRPVPTLGFNTHGYLLDIWESENRNMLNSQWKINQSLMGPESHVNEAHQDGVYISSLSPTTPNRNQQTVSTKEHGQRRPKLAFILTSPPASTPAMTPLSPLTTTPVSLSQFSILQSPDDHF